MKNVQRLAVYCGSASGSDAVFAHAAHTTAEEALELLDEVAAAATQGMVW